MSVPFHPLAEIFPLLENDEFDALVADIRAHGLREPITLHDGQILDGRNRYRACLVAGVEPVYRDWHPSGLAVDYVWSLNGPRRHLDGPARQLAAGRYAIAREDEARKRQLAAIAPPSSSLQICSDEAGRSAALAAEKFHVSERTVAHSIKLLKHGSAELVEAARRGEVAVSTASELAECSPEEQREIVARGESQILKAARAIRAERTAKLREKRTQKLARLSQQRTELPTTRTYPIVYADPPWRYEHPTMSETRLVENHYPTMDLAALCDLPVQSLATEDALLFIWVPPAILEDSFQVIRAWGFDYRTGLVWVKDKIGMGNYVRNQHEHLLIARRGEPPLPHDAARPPSVVEAPRRAHSVKPEAIYDLLDAMYPTLPKIELFARTTRMGWAAWGNELPAVPAECAESGIAAM